MPLCYTFIFILNQLSACAVPEGGAGDLPPPPPLKNHKNIGFLSNTDPDPLENHKATKPAFNAGPTAACKQNTI